MSRESLVFILGLLLMFVPFLGILERYKHGIVFAIGVVLFVVGYSLRRTRYLRTIERGNGERGNDSFVERFQERIDYSGTSLGSQYEAESRYE